MAHPQHDHYRNPWSSGRCGTPTTTSTASTATFLSSNSSTTTPRAVRHWLTDQSPSYNDVYSDRGFGTGFYRSSR